MTERRSERPTMGQPPDFYGYPVRWDIPSSSVTRTPPTQNQNANLKQNLEQYFEINGPQERPVQENTNQVNTLKRAESVSSLGKSHYSRDYSTNNTITN